MLAKKKPLTIKQRGRVVTTTHANEKRRSDQCDKQSRNSKNNAGRKQPNIQGISLQNIENSFKNTKSQLNRNVLNAYSNEPNDFPKQY